MKTTGSPGGKNIPEHGNKLSGDAARTGLQDHCHPEGRPQQNLTDHRTAEGHCDTKIMVYIENTTLQPIGISYLEPTLETLAAPVIRKTYYAKHIFKLRKLLNRLCASIHHYFIDLCLLSVNENREDKHILIND